MAYFVGYEYVHRRHATAPCRRAMHDHGATGRVTSYELFMGVEKCSKPAQERAKVELLLKTVNELPFDSTAAVESARIRALLESQGQPIGPYDVLLAMRSRDHSPW